MSNKKISARKDPLLFAGACVSALLFGLFSFGMVMVLADGVKDSEVAVVSLYTASCITAFVATIGPLVHSHRWAIVVSLAAATAAIGCFALESDLRSTDTNAISMILIGLPAFMAVFIGAGYLKTSGRRAAASQIPSVRVHER